MKLWRSRRRREADAALEAWRLLAKQAEKDMRQTLEVWERALAQLRDLPSDH